MIHNYRWKIALIVPRCHRWFLGVKLDGTDGVAVCDESGSRPDETDDGVIWLDTDRPMIVEGTRAEHISDPQWVNCKIYGLTDGGEQTSIGGTNGIEVEKVRERFKLGIEYRPACGHEIQYR